MKIYGLDLDEAGRCRHYHKVCDVVSLKCAKCGKYYACYQCHDEMEDHQFVATNNDEEYPVICGVCKKLLTREEYMTGACVHCKTEFNPRCKLHYDIYFKK